MKFFTDRETEIKTFKERLLDPNSNFWILSFSGISGIGKSQLVKYLMTNYCTNQSVKAHNIDFYINPLRTDYVLFLDELQHLFESCFDKNIYIPKREELLKQRMARIEVKNEIIAAQGGTIIADSISQVVEVGKALKSWEDHIKNSITTAFIESLTNDPIDKKMILFIDSFETLLHPELEKTEENKSYMDWLFGVLFKKIHHKISQFRLVIVGQQSFTYKPLSQEWNDYELKHFEAQDTNKYLTKRNITDPNSHKVIYELTKGLPILTSMAADLFEDNADYGMKFDLTEFIGWREKFEQQAIDEYLLKRIIDRLTESPLKQIIRFGMVLRIFNIDALRAVLKDCIQVESVDWTQLFDKLKHYSFIEQRGPFWKFHDLVRNLQRKALHNSEPSKHLKLNENALHYFSEQMESCDGKSKYIYLIETLYHSFQINEKTGLKLWDRYEKEVKIEWNFELWRSMLDELKGDDYKKFPKAAVKRTRSEGFYFYRSGEWDKSLTCYEKSKELAENEKDNEEIILCLLKIATVYQAKGRGEESNKYCNQALELIEIDNQDIMATAYNDLGDIKQERGEWNEAVKYYQNSLKIRETLGDEHSQAIIHNNLGHTYQLKGEWDKVDIHLKNSLKIREKLKDRVGLASTYNSMGNIAQERGLLSKAIEYYGKSLTVRKKIEDKIGESNVYNNLGLVYQANNDLGKAIEYYEKSLKIKKDVGYSIGIASTYINLGIVFHIKKEFEQARKCYEEGIVIAEKSDDKAKMAFAYNNLGLLLKSQENYTEAIEHYKKSLILKQDNKVGTAHTLNNIGVIHGCQNEWGEAIELYKQSLKIKEEIQNEPGIATSYNNLGVAYQAIGNYQESLIFYNNAYRLLETLGDKSGMYILMNNMDSIYKIASEYDKSMEKLLIMLQDKIATLKSEMLAGHIIIGEEWDRCRDEWDISVEDAKQAMEMVEHHEISLSDMLQIYLSLDKQEDGHIHIYGLSEYNLHELERFPSGQENERLKREVRENNIAVFQTVRRDFESALHHFHKCLHHVEENYNFLIICNNMVATFFHCCIHDHPQFWRRCLEHHHYHERYILYKFIESEQYQSKIPLSIFYNNIGVLLNSDYDEYLYFFDKTRYYMRGYELFEKNYRKFKDARGHRKDLILACFKTSIDILQQLENVDQSFQRIVIKNYKIAGGGDTPND